MIPVKADLSPERKLFLFQVIKLCRYCNWTFHLQMACYGKELKSSTDTQQNKAFDFQRPMELLTSLLPSEINAEEL